MRTLRKLTPEGQVKQAVRYWLKLHGWKVINIFQTLGCEKGISDLIAIKNARVLFLEIKKPAGKQSPYQVEFERDILAHGGNYAVIRSVADIEKTVRELQVTRGNL